MAAVSFFGLIAILAVALAVGSLFSRRTRPYGLVVLGLVGLGVFFGLVSLRLSVRSSSFPNDLNSSNLALEQSLEQQLEVARLQAEVVENQRKAARMDDAFVQTSPDGSTLETYPDGMQVSQRGYDGFRSIVRPADGRSHAGESVSYSQRSQIKLWILGAPLLALLVAFLALRGRKQGGSGVGWLVVASAAALLLVGFTFFGYTSTGSQSRTTVTSNLIALNAGANAELARVHQEIIKDVQGAVPQEPLESLWNKFTQPKIKLELPDSPPITANQEELAEAARVILSASAPGADPFTQGWLMNAAKAIMNATPKMSESSAQVVVAESAAPPVAPSTPVTQVKVVTVSETEEDLFGDDDLVGDEPRDGPKPVWVANPPKLVGNTRRVVVSTDPYVSVEECHVALREKLRGVVQTRVDELARAHGGLHSNTPGINSMGITIEYILSELCPEEDYIETINTSVGEMKRAYALVEFNEAQDRFLLDRWRDYARVESLEIVGGLLAFVVAGLAFVYGLLRVDTWTRGYYTKRLFLGVPAIIIFFGLALVNFFTD